MTRVVVPLIFCSWLSAQPLLTVEEQRGRQIYERGSSVSGGAITASLGAGNSSIPGSVLPCANCHGHDGHGKAEGGIVPSDITWDALTKPYGVTHANGRTHPPYTERLLKRAITMGIDPAGNSLETAMPRFQLSNEDMSDLVAYVKRLGQNVDPGLTATSIRVGVILPSSGRLNQLVRDTITRYAAEWGGAYGRRLDIRFTEFTAAKDLRDFIARDRMFAFAASFLTTHEEEIGDVLRETATPCVAAFGTAPATSNPYVFYLDGGEPEQLDDRAAWTRATASAEVITEALKRAGRDVSREALIQELEGFHQVMTSMGTPISFGPNRRVGVKVSDEVRRQ